MISSEYTSQAVCFFIYDDNNKLVEGLDNKYWENHAGIKYELKALLENEVIAINDSCFVIPINTIYESLLAIEPEIGDDENVKTISPELISFLNIPPIGHGVLELESKGSFRSENFRILRIYTLENQKINITTSSLLNDSENNLFLLSQGQNEACRIISELKDNEQRGQEDNFRAGAELKRLSQLSDDIKIIGGRLLKEHVEDVSNIRPRFSPSPDGGINLKLDLESGNNEEFEELVRSSPSFQEIFTSHGSGTERKRFILSEESKKAVNSFRRKSHFTREEKRLLIEQPEEYLDGFNLDDYSDRVIGYGILYAPKVSAFQGEDGTEWISVDLLPLAPETGDENEDIKPVSKHFEFDEEKAISIQKLIEEAEASGLDTVEIDGQEILISKELKEAVHKKIEPDPSFGLVTKSNIDKTTYSEGELLDIVPPDNLCLSLPDIFSDQYILKDYQKYGYGWLNWICEKDFSGCLLADDMGMGKTIQICALLALYKSLNLLDTSLLIVPPILMDEWEKELEKFVHSITKFHVRQRLSENDIDTLKQYDLIIITYQTHLQNQRVLGKIPFKFIICDEVQFIKNPASARTQAVLAMNGKHKIAATATPIENSISELWSILDYSNPGLLPPLREFNKRYGERQVSDKVFDSNISQLKKHLSPIVLRRTKDEFLKNELPEKTINTHFCPIDEKQILLNHKIIHAFKEEKTITNFLHFFQLIVMALTNPELLDGAYDIVFNTDYIAPKLLKTMELLREIKRKNEKVLVFADRKRVQYKLKEVFKHEFGIEVNIINGQTPATIRTQYTLPFRPEGREVDEFSVLILSPKCAGFGLNLVKANHVIHYLRNFNPAVENQATDRVYRIGQIKPVFVHNLVASTNDTDLMFTVEEKLDEMIKRKQSLLKDYLYASRAGRISEADLAKELNYDNPGLSLVDIDNLSPQEFEAFSAALYSCQGYNSSLTPRHDFGADCIAVGKGGGNVLVQCKHKMPGSKSGVGNSAVQQIVAARKDYEHQKQVKFEELIVITNGRFTDQAKIQAKNNNVQLIDRHKLSDILREHPVTQSDFNDFVIENIE